MTNDFAMQLHFPLQVQTFFAVVQKTRSGKLGNKCETTTVSPRDTSAPHHYLDFIRPTSRAKSIQTEMKFEEVCGCEIPTSKMSSRNFCPAWRVCVLPVPIQKGQ
jgi:hypothetical protein